MITTFDIESALATVIKGDRIILEPGLSVSVSVFTALFSSAEGVTHANLTAIDAQRNLGYRLYLDKWLKQGLIPE